MKYAIRFLGVLVVGLGWVLASSTASAGAFRVPVGLTYISGFDDVMDYYTEELHAEEEFSVPIGLSVSPCYEFDSGLLLGVDVGPAGIILVEDTWGDDDASYVGVPIGVFCGYTFLVNKEISPYVRGGLKYHIVSGDLVDSSKPGVYGAVGVEFFRHAGVGLGIEVGYDTAEIEMDNGETIRPGGLLVGIRAVIGKGAGGK